MKRIFLAFSLSVIILLVACQQLRRNASNTSESWPHQMQNLEQALRDMIPLVYDHKEFNDPRNKKRIRARMESFSSNVHKLSPKSFKTSVGEDPLFTFTLNRFHRDMKRSIEGFDSGHIEYLSLIHI